MGIFYNEKRYIAVVLLPLAACATMIIFSDVSVMYARDAISLWLSSVVPAMLPFFICVNFMTNLGVMQLLPVNVFPFAMSVISGYPMGAKVVGDMCRSGLVDRTEAMRLISFCSTSGPVFMAGAVGIGMLNSQMAGYIIAVSHYAGAILNGLLFSLIYRHGSVGTINRKNIEESNIMEELTKAIFSAFRSLAVILAYIVFFMFVLGLFEHAGVLDAIKNDYFRYMLKGFIEMTVGCSELSSLPLKHGSILASMIISWGGISIIGQSMSMLTGTGITLKYIVLTKFTHAFFAGIISLFLANVML